MATGYSEAHTDSQDVLATTVKQVHAQLREDFKKGGKSAEEVWSHHLYDSATLTRYSQAMCHLATGPWASKQDGCDRIAWCVSQCDEYFSGGLMEQHLLKDLRRCAHSMPSIVPPILLPVSEEGVADLVRGFSSRRWSLLDVGSCYNPFLPFRQFNVTAIDIAPAHQTVIKCDFLNIHIDQPPGSVHNLSSDQMLKQHHDCLPSPDQPSPHSPDQPSPHSPDQPSPHSPDQPSLHLPDQPSPHSPDQPSPRSPDQLHIQTCPDKTITVIHSDYYDIVVFSLFLSYLPSPAQRLKCCVKAHKILRVHGLLVVITPDSSHQNKHAALMKAWKGSIEAIGYHRWRYEKKLHLHCMIFRKIRCEGSVDGEEGLAIPQDREDDALSFTVANDEQTEDVLDQLPFSLLDMYVSD